jgi:hypothetical protein
MATSSARQAATSCGTALTATFGEVWFDLDGNAYHAVGQGNPKARQRS